MFIEMINESSNVFYRQWYSSYEILNESEMHAGRLYLNGQISQSNRMGIQTAKLPNVVGKILSDIQEHSKTQSGEESSSSEHKVPNPTVTQ